MDLPETGPLRLHLGPALGDQVEYVPGAVVRVGEGVEHDPGLQHPGNVLQDPLVGQLLEGLLPGEGEDLPERDPEGPDVALSRVLALNTDN